nr:MAG: hypothetical protein [Bole Tick Virus 3]
MTSRPALRWIAMWRLRLPCWNEYVSTLWSSQRQLPPLSSNRPPFSPQVRQRRLLLQNPQQVRHQRLHASHHALGPAMTAIAQEVPQDRGNKDSGCTTWAAEIYDPNPCQRWSTPGSITRALTSTASSKTKAPMATMTSSND